METNPFFIRTTLWHDDGGNLRQVSVAVLDALWEPQAEITRNVGPFDDVDQVVKESTSRARAAAWWTCGQGRLAL